MVLLIFQSLYGPPDKSVFHQVDNRDHMGDHAAGIAKVQVNNIHRLPHDHWASHPSVVWIQYIMLRQPTTSSNLQYFSSNTFGHTKDSELCPAELLESIIVEQRLSLSMAGEQ